MRMNTCFHFAVLAAERGGGRRGGGGGAEGRWVGGGCMPSPLNNYKLAWYLVSIRIMDIIGPLRHCTTHIGA